MNRMIFVVLAFALTGALAGCSSTGTGSPDPAPEPEPEPQPEPFPDNVNADLVNGLESATVHTDGLTVDHGTAIVQMDEPGNHMTVAVDGTTYMMAANGPGAPYNSPAWDNPVNYTFYNFSNPNDDGQVILGRYMALSYLGSAAGDLYIMHGGLDTPDNALPAQLVEYEGFWAVRPVAAAIGSSVGAFDANADFDAGTIQFDITDMTGTTAMGSGAGTITGSTFASSFNVSNGADSSVNNVAGNFYGPGAEEMAGLIDGFGGGDETVGFLFGHQK